MEKAGAAISYLIGVLLMTYFFFVLKNKFAEDPQFSVFGLKGKAVLKIAAMGIAIFVLLTVAVLAGWIRH